MNLDLNKLSYSQALKILAVILLSEGYVNSSRKNSTYIRLSTLSSSEEQHALFENLCVKLFNKSPQKYYYKKLDHFNNSYFRVTDSELTISRYIKKLCKLSPTFKTTPGRLSKKEFLRSKQPTIKFMFNEPKFLKELAIRIWFDFDGSIVPSFKLKNKKDKKGSKTYNYLQVQFECEIYIAETNPNLIKELQKLCDSLGIRSRIKYDKRKWSGIDGIMISDLNSIKKFIKLGPITDITISGKSKRFNGVRKKEMCKAVSSLLLDKKIPLSKYFKNKKQATEHRFYLNSFLEDKIKEVQ